MNKSARNPEGAEGSEGFWPRNVPVSVSFQGDFLYLSIDLSLLTESQRENLRVFPHRRDILLLLWADRLYRRKVCFDATILPSILEKKERTVCSRLN